MTSRDTNTSQELLGHIAHGQDLHPDSHNDSEEHSDASSNSCLLYTSDAADE